MKEVKLPHKYTVDSDVLTLFATLSKRKREHLLRVFQQLAADPFVKGEFRQRDHVGRECEVKRFDEWVVTFWPEHLAGEVHVIAIEYLRL